MGLANMGRLLTALNPLDQSAVQQITKATAGQGMFKRAMSFAQAGAKQIARGGYFRGINRAAPGMGKMGSQFARSPVGRLEAGDTRMAAAGVIGAWVGLNAFAPDSSLTRMANYGAMAGVGIGISRGPLMSKFGTLGRNVGYAATAGGIAAKMFGAF